MRRSWWMAMVCGLGCVTPVAPPAPELPPPPPIVVPEGCLADQAGAWVHAGDPSFRYLGEDDGGTLTLLVERVLVPDAGFSPRRFRADAGVDGGLVDAGVRPGPRRADAGVDAGPSADAGDAADAGLAEGEEDGGITPTVRVTLARTPAGFVGEAVTTLRHPAGRLCDVRFPTRVLACGDGGLTLETDSAAAVGDACQPPARPQGLTREVHRLVRPPAR